METTLPKKTESALVNMSKANVEIGGRGVILDNIDSLFRFSTAVANSGICPKDFIGKPESVMVAIQMGMELGLTPMAALQNIAVINGRPSVWGDAQVAIVRATGLVEDYAESETNNDIEPLFRELAFAADDKERLPLLKKISGLQSTLKKEADDFGVSVYIKRKGYDGQFGRFTVADAKKAQLWGKAGPWTQYPFRMLKWRARSFLLRDTFPDALRGLLSVEEARDIEEPVAAAELGQVRRTRTSRNIRSVPVETVVRTEQPEASVDSPNAATAAESSALSEPSPSPADNSSAQSASVESSAAAPATDEKKDYLPDLDKPEESILKLIKMYDLNEATILRYLQKLGKANKEATDLLSVPSVNLRGLCAHWKSHLPDIQELASKPF